MLKGSLFSGTVMNVYLTDRFGFGKVSLSPYLLSFLLKHSPL